MGEEELKEEVEKPKEEPEKEPEEKEVPAEPEYSEIEKTAMKIGWNPTHKGERDFVSAEEFIIRSKEIQDTMSAQQKAMNKKITDLERGIKNINAHNESVYRAQVAKLKSEVVKLQTQRRQAVEDGDNKTVDQIDAQIDRIDKIPDTPPSTETPQNPEFEAWRDKNDWYDQDTELKAYADAQGAAPEFQGLPYSVLLDKVTERVKTMFPDKFPELKKKSTPPAPTVEPSTPRKTTSSKSKHTYADLTDSQKKMCDEFVKLGAMTREQYIKDLEDIGELK